MLALENGVNPHVRDCVGRRVGSEIDEARIDIIRPDVSPKNHVDSVGDLNRAADIAYKGLARRFIFIAKPLQVELVVISGLD